MRFHGLAILVSAPLLSWGAHAQVAKWEASALETIQAAARTLCSAEPVQAADGALTLTPGMKAQLRDVLAKVAVLAIDDGAGIYLSARYRALLPFLQRDLAEDIDSSGGTDNPDACARKLSQTLAERLLPSKPWLPMDAAIYTVRNGSVVLTPQATTVGANLVGNDLSTWVFRPPSGDMTLLVNGKTIIAGGKVAVGKLIYCRVDSASASCDVRGLLSDLNLRPGRNSLVIKFGAVSLPPYRLIVTKGQADSASQPWLAQ
jgi:hypothetical protein